MVDLGKRGDGMDEEEREGEGGLTSWGFLRCAVGEGDQLSRRAEEERACWEGDGE